MSKLERLQIFLHVIEENSFAKASRKLKVSTAAVSKQVSSLEKDLGIQLLHRTTRSLELTDAGRLYYEYGKRVLKDVEELDAIISGMRSEPSGTLKIVSQRQFGRTYIIPHLSEFLAKYPKLSLSMELAERIPDLQREKIDVLIGMSIPTSSETIQRKIGMTRYIICASPEYLKVHGTPQKPMDLLKHRYITHSMRSPDNSLTFKHGKQVHLEPYIRLNDTQAMLECAKAGLGIVKLHEYVVRDALDKNELVEIMQDQHDPDSPIYLAYPERRYVQPKIRHFIDFFVAKYQNTGNKD